MAAEKQQNNNRLGYISKSKDGNSTMLTVEQDMVLKAGDRLILEKPSDEVKRLQERGFIDEETANSRISKIPNWKLYNAKLLPRNK